MKSDQKIIKIDIEDPSLYTTIAFIIDNPTVYTEIQRLKKKWSNKISFLKNEHEFESDIMKTMRTKNFPYQYYQLIKQAIKFSRIYSFSRVIPVAIPNRILQDSYLLSESIPIESDVQLVLLTSFDASKEEVVKAFQGMKKNLKQNESIKNIRGLEELNLPPQAGDTISNIKRDREWYWMHQNGMSYGRILKTTKGISKQGIIEAIVQYKKRLEVKL